MTWFRSDGTTFDLDRRRFARRHPLLYVRATWRVRRDVARAERARREMYSTGEL